MAKTVKQLIQEVDERTTTLGNIIAEALANGVSTPEDLAKLQAVSDHLLAMGQEFDNPVPELPAALTTTTT
jgi:hypothetical protein